MTQLNMFSVGFQNVQGLHGATGCKVNEIAADMCNDIEILAEVWGCKCKNVSFGTQYTNKFVEPQKHEGVKKGRKSGGFHILLKKNMLFGKDVLIRKTSNNFIWLEIDKRFIKNLQKNFFVVAVYINDITSSYYDDKIFQQLHTDILEFGSGDTPILFMGDFNGRTGTVDDVYRESHQIENTISVPTCFSNVPIRSNCDEITNSHGKKIIDICLAYNIIILNGRTKGDMIGNFTHLNNNRGVSTVDYSLCNEHLIDCVETFMVLPLTGLSDHSKITTIFKDGIPVIQPPKDDYEWKPLKRKFKWDKQNKQKFVNALRNSVKEKEEISQRIEAGLIESSGSKIQELFILAANQSLTIKKNKTDMIDKNWKKRKKSKKWFDKECKSLKAEVNKSAKEKHGDPHNNVLRFKYHEKLKEFKQKCKIKRSHFWENKFNEVENSLNNPKEFWKKWKSTNEFEVQSQQSNITGKQWFDNFKKLHTENTVENMESQASASTQPTKRNCEPFTKKQFSFVINNLKNEKATGYDCILNEMLKSSPPCVRNLLFDFINLCLKNTLVPQSWCFELLHPIYKDGNMDDPDNYRGICISSALMKVLCMLLNNRVQVYCNEQSIINKNQIGFIRNHRTSDHLLALKAVVSKYVTTGKKKLFACFIDFRKAFDSVPHKGIFECMEKIGFSGKELELMKDIYKKTKCAVKVNDKTTDFFNFTKGVRQGCPLSPILFNIYVNEIFNLVNENNEASIYLGNTKVNALMYADDLILLCESREGLQNLINKINDFCIERKLSVNAKKTKSMVFNRGNKLIKANLLCNNSPLEDVKTFKYLGITISAKNCSFSPTIDDLSTKANRAIFALNNKIKISKIPPKLALKIFNAQIVPILLYGSEVWGPYMDYDYDKWDKSKIERTQTQFLKRMLGCSYSTSNNMTRGEVGVRPLLVQIIKRVVAYIGSIKERNLSLANVAFRSELNTELNMTSFLNKFDLNANDLHDQGKFKIKKVCNDNYDRYWLRIVSESPKALSYILFKSNVRLEKYLHQIKNISHRKAMSRFRLSNHSLLIEKGRHLRPPLGRNDRKCFICKGEVENEKHFLITCPLYENQRENLFHACRQNSRLFDSLISEDEKFIFIMTNEDVNVIKSVAKFLSDSFKFRELNLD